MFLSAIVAMASNRVIGKNGDLPWRIPEDFKFFKDKTTGHIMVMGRKTFESLPGLLPNRLHVVITRQKDYRPPGVHVFADVKSALEFCASQTEKWGDEVFIIGGGEIFRETLPITDRIYLTEIKQAYEGDAIFPEFDKQAFKEVERRSRTEPEPFDFVTYERVRS
ncbi:MAG: dihydrofolate reductase [Bdellovibrionaceae bacterium]|nr:dihydrofolate reductase [Pseudobdellovibrionaceae bacterium]